MTELETLHPEPGFAEQYPEALYQNVLSAVRKCVEIFQRSVSIELHDIKLCGIANQRETFVLWDKSGTPLYNAVLSQCK